MLSEVSRSPRIIQAATASMLVALLTGCVAAQRPFYREKDLKTLSGLTGKWISSEPGRSKEGLSISLGADGLYDVIISADGKDTPLTAALIQLNGRWFADLHLKGSPISSGEAPDLVFQQLLHHYHHIIRFSIDDTLHTLRFSVLDSDQFKAKWSASTVFEESKSPPGIFVLTESTEKLQAFLASIPDEDPVFKPGSSLIKEDRAPKPK